MGTGLEYCLLILSSLSFFSFAIRASSSLLKMIGPDVVMGSLVLEEALEILEIDDLESSSGANIEDLFAAPGYFGGLAEIAAALFYSSSF